MANLDISDLPVPSKNDVDISDLPTPPSVGEQFASDVGSALSAGHKSAGLSPFLLGGAGELTKGVGAATELFAPQTGQAITKTGQRFVEEAQKLNPVTSRVGQATSYLAPYGAASKGLQAGRTALGMLPKATGYAGKAVEMTAPAAATGYVTTPTEEDRKKSAAIATGLGLFGEGVLGAYRTGKQLVQSLQLPEKFGVPQALADVGDKIIKLVGPKMEKDYELRASQAKKSYDDAINIAREKQSTQPFALSPQGRQLINELEASKYYTDPTGQRFTVGEDKIKAIDRLIDSIKGEVKGAKEVPAGKGKIASQIMVTKPGKATEKDITALIEELRYLREVDTSGKPYEAYGALSAQYKKDLAKRFERALYDWNPSYEQADTAYKLASRELNKYKTEAMSRALRGEKFDFKQLAASPEEYGKLFFSDTKGVQDLKNVIGPQQTKELSADYVASLFDNKSPQEVYQFAFNRANEGWLREAGIFNEVQAYAKQAKSATNKIEILKKMGFYGAASAVGYKAAHMLGYSPGLFGD